MARAPAAGQQVEPVGQSLGDALDAHHARPGGGQLDGQRDPVQALADGGHGRGVVVGYGEVRPRRPGPVGEQPGRLGSVQGADAQRPSSLGHGKAGHPPDHLARLPRAAGGRWPDSTRRPQLRTSASARAAAADEHVLAVVQHDQGVPFGELGGERLGVGLVGRPPGHPWRP